MGNLTSLPQQTKESISHGLAYNENKISSNKNLQYFSYTKTPHKYKDFSLKSIKANVRK